ncbi:thioesterase II family protein [Kitasatospora indigofera]|uniref:thioesterase II family protein n=1 Tax=Kitasatospora indigofera TaxID=67307 RepID=UPI003661956B
MTPGRPRVEGDWLLVPAPQQHRPFRLFCFPHAGGDATAYLPLAHALAPLAEVWALRMPARGGRGRHPMPATFDQLVRTVVAELGPHLEGPFGFYGQSLGALLAFETARALPPGRRPRLLVTASAQPPSAWTDGRPQHRDAEELLRLAGTADLVSADPELREIALHAIRTDLEVRHTYRYRPAPPIESDLHAVVGDADPMLGAAQLDDWARHTSGTFGLTVVPGGHLLATVEQRGPAELLTSLITSRPAEPVDPRGPVRPTGSARPVDLDHLYDLDRTDRPDQPDLRRQKEQQWSAPRSI